MFYNLKSHLDQISPDSIVASDGVRRLSYSDLLSQAKEVSDLIGDDRQLIILECNISIEWLIAYVGVIIGGHVPILLPSEQSSTLSFFKKKFKPNCIIKTSSGIDIERCHNELIPIHEELCLMLSTSGSTGSPKCVKLSHENLTSNTASIAEYLKITSNDVGTVNLPTNYSFGLSIVNSHIYMGGTILFNQHSMVEDSFWELCDQQGATSFAGVPHSYDLLSRIDFKAKIPQSIRYFTQAGGKLAKDKVELFAKYAASRSAEFFVMYGQTEASPRISYLPPELAEHFPTSIGVPVPGGKLSVVDDNGLELPCDVDGELLYEGPNVMMGYALEPDDLIIGDETEKLFTGDIARRLDNGLFVITGRKSRFIKIFGNRISLDQIEVLLHEQNYSAIATGIDEKLFVVTKDKGSENQIELYLSNRLKIPKGNILIEYMDEFPTLSTGKMDYTGLRSKLEVNIPKGQKITIRDIYASIFGSEADDTTKSFIELGGDSLTFVRVSVELESILDTLPENWANLSIEELEKSLPKNSGSKAKSEKFNRLSNIDTLRAIVCVLVVAFHVFGNNVNFGLNIDNSSPYRSFFEVFSLLRMPLFTALAGVLFIAMVPSREKFGEIFKNKVLTLLLPAVFVSLIYFYLRSFLGKETGEVSSVLIEGYLHLWYLYALFIITMVIGVIHIYTNPSLASYIILGFVAFSLSYSLNDNSIFHIKAALELTPYFILGMLLYKKIDIFLRKEFVFVSVVLTLIGSGIKLLEFFEVIDFPYLTHYFWLLVSLSFILVSYRFIPKVTSIEWIGIYTYAIYLWHPLANATARTLLEKLGYYDRALLFFIGLISGIIIPIILYRLCNYLPKFVRQSLMGR